jgi:predicted transport protein
MRKSNTDRIGITNYNNYGSKMIIVEYKSSNNIVVLFPEYNYSTKSRYDNFLNGKVKSPYCKSVYNIGYIGEGVYKTTIDNKHDVRYNYWITMLQRCYSDKFHQKNPTYKNCTVCEEWYNYQNFCSWFDNNYYKIENEIMELDKDILCKGNKIYSPEKCIFVPKRINGLFTKCDNSRGKHPIGIYYDESINKFCVRCNNICRNYLGCFDTSKDAFYLGYKPFKELCIKEIAEKYKDIIPINLYNAMINWKVEITD